MATLQEWTTEGTWVYPGSVSTGRVAEADLVHDGTNYYMFATATDNPGNVWVYKGATIAAMLASDPFYIATANVNLHATIAPVNNGDGTVTFKVSQNYPVTTGTLVQVQGNAGYSNNGTWVAATFVSLTQFKAPGTFSGSAGGTVRQSYLIQYPTAVYDSGTWHLWANYTSSYHLTFAGTLDSTTAWTTQSSNVFSGSLVADITVRKHPTDGYWYLVGLLSATTLTLYRSTSPNGPWTSLGNPFAIDGTPSWASSALPDPGIAFTQDGREWLLLRGYNGSAYAQGIVEIRAYTGRVVAAAENLPTADPDLSDFKLLSIPGSPDRVYGFAADYIGYMQEPTTRRQRVAEQVASYLEADLGLTGRVVRGGSVPQPYRPSGFPHITVWEGQARMEALTMGSAGTLSQVYDLTLEVKLGPPDLTPTRAESVQYEIADQLRASLWTDPTLGGVCWDAELREGQDNLSTYLDASEMPTLTYTLQVTEHIARNSAAG